MTGEPEPRARPDPGLGLSITVSAAFLAVAAVKLWPGSFLDSAPREVFYLETTPTPRSRALVLSAFVAHGYRLAEPHDFGGRAAAFLFERPVPSA